MTRMVARAILEVDPLLAVATVTAGALGFLFLGKPSLWVDEIFSATAARLSLSRLWGLVTSSQANMGLYYFLLHFWIRFVGDGDSAIRALSVLPAVATVPVFYGLGRRLFGSLAAGLACVLLSVNAFFITYAQQARGYSLVLLLVTVSSYSFVRAIEQPSRRWWIAYVVASTLAVYTHLFAILVPPAHLVSLLFLKRRPKWWRRLATSVIAIGLAVSPMALFVLTRNEGQIAWISAPSAWGLVAAVEDWTGGRASLVAAYFILCCLGLRPLFRGNKNGEAGDATWRYAFTLAWLLLPVVVSVTFSLAVTPIFEPRYLIISLPPLVLLAAAGLAGLDRGWLRLGAVVLVVLLAIRGLVSRYGSEIEGWREATSFVLSEARPHDTVVFCPPGTRGAFDYYVNELGASARAPQPLHGGVLGGRPPSHLWIVVRQAADPSACPPIQRVLAHSETRQFAGVLVARYQG